MFKNRFSPFLCQNSSQNQTIIMLDQGESVVMLQKQAQALPDWSKWYFDLRRAQQITATIYTSLINSAKY